MLWYLGYMVLFVDNFEQMMEFYSKKVGLPVRLRADGYAEFAVEGSKFALLTRTRAAELVGQKHAGRPAPGAHDSAVTILVDDVDKVYRDLSGRGVQFVGGPADRLWGQRTAYFCDPEGHLIEIGTNLPRAERPGV
ncbi:MAG TPA: VOC family protein [Candidatus Baltobacteraceae bacterium]|nr:VOC family protein [Candidatus Baltobacteraceae bacterium]